MSVVVAIKDKDRVFVAADSQSTCGCTKYINNTDESNKLFIPLGLENGVMGITGNSVDTQYLKGKHLFPIEAIDNDEIDLQFVRSELNWHIYDVLDKKGLASKNDDGNPAIEDTILFAYRDKIYEINRDLFTREYTDEVAIGSGRDAAYGSLYTTRGKDVIYRLLKAITCSKDIDVYVNYPIFVTDTETMDLTIYYKEDIDEILKGDVKQ